MPLHEWETFYVIVGSSAAALTGLMFVVIALSAERRKLAAEDSARAAAPLHRHPQRLGRRRVDRHERRGAAAAVTLTRAPINACSGRRPCG